VFAKNDRRSFADQHEDNSYLEGKRSGGAGGRQKRKVRSTRVVLSSIVIFVQPTRESTDLVAFGDSDFEESEEDELLETNEESSGLPTVKPIGLVALHS
jgi:hypothetical protein